MISWNTNHIIIAFRSNRLPDYSVHELEEISDSLTVKITETEEQLKGAVLCEELQADLRLYRQIKERVASLIEYKYTCV